MKMTNELKTGIIVVAGILVMMLFYVKTTDFTGSPYKIKTYFNYAEGIKEDSIVKLSGIEIGRVEKIQFQYEPETRVELVLTIKSIVKVHEDAIAFIATSGMIGDAYIGLTPGTPGKPFLKSGSIIGSEDPIEMRKLWKKAEAIADNLDKTLIEVKSLTQNVNGMVTDNKSRIDNIVVNIEQTAVNFKDFSEDIKKNPWKLLMKGK